MFSQRAHGGPIGLPLDPSLRRLSMTLKQRRLNGPMPSSIRFAIVPAMDGLKSISVRFISIFWLPAARDSMRLQGVRKNPYPSNRAEILEFLDCELAPPGTGESAADKRKRAGLQPLPAELPQDRRCTTTLERTPGRTAQGATVPHADETPVRRLDAGEGKTRHACL
jgi:hypothetical protein